MHRDLLRARAMLGVPFPEPEPKREPKKWRTWEELTSGERFDIAHAENPPSLKTALQSLWRIVADGWECKDRSDIDPKDLS